MIITLKNDTQPAKAEELAKLAKAYLLKDLDKTILVTPSGLKELPPEAEAFTEKYVSTDSDIQLASQKYRPELRTITFGNTSIGGNTGNTMMIAGPCSAESEEQIEQTALLLKEQGISTMRAGCYKPRTSPYTFRGLGLDGLKILAAAREKYGLNIITEVRDHSHVHDVIEYADIIQIGAKAMYDHGILEACSKTQKPVLLKRGFGSTLQEFVQAAEFVLSGGNPNVMLCERGIRTFETKTRFTLDLCGVAWLQANTNLPVVLDPSHAMGYAYGVPDLTRACLAMGVDGLLIEVHPTPAKALSDASQQLDHDTFRALMKTLNPIAAAIGKKVI